MIKAIFLDVDGTLISFKTHRVPASALDALREAHARGVQLFIACLPIAIVGFFSAKLQGRVACSAIGLLGKRGDSVGQGIVLTVMVETYAVLALLASFLIQSGV